MNEAVHEGDVAATDRLGPYLLVAQLGAGAMGRVFLGSDGNGRQAAIKVVRSDLAEIPAFRKRFSRELEVAERIHSPRVAEILNAQTEGPRPWLATEYVPGPTLQAAVDEGGGFGSDRLRALAAAIAEALLVIHAAEVVHRDLKPANVLLGPDGPKVIDFGVARALDASLLTNTGQTLGTPAYMSPEQADGRSVHSASDVFALGSLLVFAATGRLAFGDGAPLAILHRVVNNEPDLTGVAEDDAVLRGIIEGCLAKEPDDRPSPQHIVDTFGTAGWQPVTSVAREQPGLGVARTQPGLGVGLSTTASASADVPTVAIPPQRGGKRIAVISVATVAALIAATIAVVESSGGGGKGNLSAGTPGKNDTASGAGQNGGSLPATGGTSGSGGAGGQNPTSGGPNPAPSTNGAVVPVKSGGGSATTGQGNSAPFTITVSSTGAGGGQNSQPAPTSSSHPASHPSTTAQATTPPPPAPAHNPPGPMVANDIKYVVPYWVGAATVDLTWKAHSDATSYDVHWTDDFGSGSDQTVNVTGTAYSFQMAAGSKACFQVRTVNQYGSAAFYPSPMFCIDDHGNQVS